MDGWTREQMERAGILPEQVKARAKRALEILKVHGHDKTRTAGMLKEYLRRKDTADVHFDAWREDRDDARRKGETS